MKRASTSSRRQPVSDYRIAMAKILVDPGDAPLYRALYGDAKAAGDAGRAATAFALMLVCMGGLNRETEPLFLGGAWSAAGGRYYLFYFNAIADRGFVVWNEHLLERRVAAEPPPSLPRRRAILHALMPRVRVDIRRGAILVSAMPKSAGSFFCECLAAYLDFSVSRMHSANDGMETGFGLAEFLRASQPEMVAHTHLAANPRTLTMVRAFDCRPIVTLRDVFDALRSYADHIAGPWHRDERLADGSTNEGPDWLRTSVLMMAARYVEFFATWSRAARDGYEVHFERFDDITGEPVAALARTLGFLGIAVDPTRVADAVARQQRPSRRGAIRFNVGVTGRGADFSETDRTYVRSLYALYPDVDFSMIDSGFVPPG